MATPFGSHPSINPDQYLDLSWEMFGELCRALALRVARQYDPDLVVGIARAGVIPAAVIASCTSGKGGSGDSLEASLTMSSGAMPSSRATAEIGLPGR